MSLLSSLRGLIRVLGQDWKVARRGSYPGWYTINHYRGRWQSRRRTPPTTTSTRQKVGGTAVKVFVTPAHLGTLLGVFVDGEYNLKKALPAFVPKTILDLGANAGMATAYLHALYPEAEFVCVEPDPRNLGLLERTIAANGIRAKVLPAAVSDKPGELRLRFGDNPTCSALETSPMHNLADTVPVRVTTVPAILAEAGWERIDLLKIDIEGTERELLGRNNGWLDKVKAIILEIHPNTSPEEIGGFLAPFGFQLSRFGNGGEPVYLAKSH